MSRSHVLKTAQMYYDLSRALRAGELLTQVMLFTRLPQPGLESVPPDQASGILTTRATILNVLLLFTCSQYQSELNNFIHQQVEKEEKEKQ